MSERLRLADLLGGLSIVGCGIRPPSRHGIMLVSDRHSPGAPVRLPEREVANVFYVSLVFHVGCVGYAHETFAQFGDDLAVRRAAVETDLTNVRDIRERRRYSCDCFHDMDYFAGSVNASTCRAAHVLGADAIFMRGCKPEIT